MAKGEIVSVKIRPETEDEAALRSWFDKQEADTVSNLEAGARQIIQLVTAFYGVIFGVVALGKDKFEASLHLPAVIAFGAVAILALLAALIAGLVVVAPLPYRYRSASLLDQKAVYAKMLGRKSTSLLISAIAFGLGLAAFASLIVAMLYHR
jgi:Flp pilus assembly protein protease CpaA